MVGPPGGGAEERPIPAGVGRPSTLLLLTEAGRAMGDFGALLGAGALLRCAPRGEGRPVFVLPGFMADDRSTGPLRRYLRSLGYFVHGWRLGRNLGPTPAIVDGMRRRLEQLAVDHNQRVSLVGWSLGGMFARQLARAAPGSVALVTTLGSPFRGPGGVPSHATRRFERLSGLHIDLSAYPANLDRGQLAVPSTSIYTRLDGIVAWQTCLDAEGSRRENVEVVASHCGLGLNPAALWTVADRLAQDPADWQPFRRPRWLPGLFPRPASLSSARAG